ncbi:MAG TPA: phosphatase PAP2 family protein [Nannocystis sp.]
MPPARLATLLVCLSLAPPALAAPAPVPEASQPDPRDSPTGYEPAPAPVPESSPPPPPAPVAPVPEDIPSSTPPPPEPVVLAPVLAPPHPMRVRLIVDLPIIGLSTAIALGSEYVGKEQRWAGCAACDRGEINALDRTVLGNHSAAAKTVSDIGLFSLIALPFALDLGDALIQRSRDRSPGRARHLRGWGKDVVVLLETFAVTYASTNVVKFAVRRPRPYSYDADSGVADPTENDARLSFYSGHASMAFAMATSYAYLFQARHPRSRWVAPVWVIGMSLASVTAVARVEAGKHFWTDVIVGAAAGTGIGLLIPALHRNRLLGERVGLSLAPTRTGSSLLLQGRF